MILPERISYTGNTQDVIQRSVFVYGVWEPDISAWIRGFVSTGATVVDIGANTGYYTLLFSKRVGPEGRVFAFEPVPTIYAELTSNVERNGVRNVEAIQAALGETEGEIEVFRADPHNVGNSSTHWEAGHVSEGRIRMLTGDSVLLGHAEAVSLIKIDTEGDEMAVLSGLSQTISRMGPGSAILVEVTPEKLLLREKRGEHVWDFFTSLGWDAYQIRNDYDFTSYAEQRAVDLVPIPSLPATRCDLIFVKVSDDALTDGRHPGEPGNGTF
jgi:FkbM family methyltransferase